MAKPADAGKTATALEPLSRGLVLELECLALPGRRFMYESLSRILKEKDLALTPALYARFLAASSWEKGLEALLAALGKKKLSAEKLAAELAEQFTRSAQKSRLPLDAALADLLADAAKADMALGAITFLPDAVAQDLLERFGLKNLILQVMALRSRPLIEAWLKLAQAMKLPPYRCVALCTDAASCRAALAAGMRCAVIPDEYNVHQDFGGADVVASGLKEIRVKELLDLLSPCQFRRS